MDSDKESSEASRGGGAAAVAPERLEIRCRTCGATLRLEPHLRTAECPYCASSSIVERPTGAGGGSGPDPSFALGFVIDRERARELCTAWIRSRSAFTKSEFRTSLPERGRGLYMPAWLYGAVADADYTAQIGENYTETYTTTDSKGRTVTRTRTRTEWRDLAGRFATYVQDVVVTASKGVPNELLELVEPYDFRALRRYTPKLLAGWIAEDPTLDEAACTKLAHDETLASMGRRLAAHMPGDSHRNLDFRVALRDETSELVLLPVWMFAVRLSEDAEPIRILVNGQTGAVGGRAPRSWVKITAAILGGFAILGLLVLAFLAVAG